MSPTLLTVLGAAAGLFRAELHVVSGAAALVAAECLLGGLGFAVGARRPRPVQVENMDALEQIAAQGRRVAEDDALDEITAATVKAIKDQRERQQRAGTLLSVAYVFVVASAPAIAVAGVTVALHL